MIWVDTVEFSQQIYKSLIKSCLQYGFSIIFVNETVSDLSQLVKPFEKIKIDSIINNLKISESLEQSIRLFSNISDLGLLTNSRFVNTNSIVMIRRVTVLVSNEDHIAYLNKLQCSNKYDVIAVCPQTEFAWNNLIKCTNFDVLSLDFTLNRLPFALRRQQLIQFVRKNVSFEISFGSVLADSTARTNLFSNIQNILRFVPFNNIFISSRANKVSELRAPKDILNFSQLFGLKGFASNLISMNSIACLYKAAARRAVGSCIKNVGNICEER